MTALPIPGEIMAALAPAPKFYETDQNGDPLFFGKVYTYISGSTTPLATYTDAGGMSANTNPVILDSAGRADIWLLTTSLYKFKVTDANDVEIFTVNNIAASASALELAQSSGSSMVGFIQAGTGAVAYNVQNKLRSTAICLTDFGVTTASTGQQVYTAMGLAMADATALGKALYIPGGNWNYDPGGGGAMLGITTDVIGDGRSQTILNCSAATYTGVFFRVVDAYRVSDLSIFCNGAIKAGTAVQLANADIDQFTGWMELRRVHINGFAKNIDARNTFFAVFDQVRSDGGTEGFFCEPADIAGDNGYVTTHHHISCDYLGNDRNMHYKTPINSHVVLFNVVAIESATGAGPQADFENIKQFTINGFYLEGSASLRAATFTNCETSIRGLYMNGTGGIDLGSGSNAMSIENGSVTATTDVILANGTSLQMLAIRNFTGSSSGNLFNANSMQFQNSTLEGTYYPDFIVGGTQIREGFSSTSNPILNVDSLIFTWVAGGTIAANTTTTIALNVSRAGCFTNATAVACIVSGQATLAGVQGPLSFTVGPAETGSADFYCLYAHNTSAGGVVVPANSQFRITFTRFKT
jgi:hypothetical protein